jgi:purine-cytosine permease-like protein
MSGATAQAGAEEAGRGSRDLLSKLESSDLLEEVVPASRRDGPLKMTLLWVTFQATVSNMYTGYLARSAGMSLGDMLWACLIGVVVMIGYGMLAANVGTITGQPHSVLARGVLGKSGSALASLLLAVTGMGWYGFQAVFLAQLFSGLFGLTHLQLFCAIFALVMIANNLLGFRSVSGYARLVAAPVLLVWGTYTIIKALASAAGPHLFAVPHVAASQGILLTVGLLVGVAMFGNEPDIFRYARRDRGHNIVSLGFGYGLGLLIFPVAGYLMAELSSASNLGATIQFFTKFSLLGLTALAVVVFTINIFALNDANLYEAVNAVQNFLRGRRRIETIIALGVIGAVVAVFMQRSSSGCRRPAGQDGAPRAVTSWAEASPGNAAAIVAILAGLVVGAITGGLIPGTSGFGKTNVGIPAVQAWATTIGLYLAAMLLARVLHSDRAKQILLGLPAAQTTAQTTGQPAGAAETATA